MFCCQLLCDLTLESGLEYLIFQTLSCRPHFTDLILVVSPRNSVEREDLLYRAMTCCQPVPAKTSTHLGILLPELLYFRLQQLMLGQLQVWIHFRDHLRFFTSDLQHLKIH